MVDNAAEPEIERGARDRALQRLAGPGLQLQDRPDGDRAACATRPSGSMGARFDIKAFHDAMLLSGAMPLTVLERRIRAWTAA